VERELAEILRDHCDHAGVMRPGGDLTEVDGVSFDEKFDTEDAVAAECSGDCLSDPAGLGQGCGAHRLGLPTLAVVAIDLNMAILQ